MTDEKTPDQLRAEFVQQGKLPSDEDLRAVAAGEKPKPWRQTYQHPIHGELEFSMELPDVRAMARHGAELSNWLSGVNQGAEPTMGLMRLAAAIAGMKELVKLPVVDERRTADDDEQHERIERVYYDPEAELSEFWLVQVWEDASAWRTAFIAPGALDRLGKSSGETPGNGSDTTSVEPGASPSTTPA